MAEMDDTNMVELRLNTKEILDALTAFNEDNAICAVDRAKGVVDLLITSYQIDRLHRADDESCQNALWAIRHELEYLEGLIEKGREGTSPLFLKVCHHEPIEA